MQTGSKTLKSCLLVSLLLYGATAQAQLQDIIKHLPKRNDRPETSVAELLDGAMIDPSTLSESQQKHMCGFDRRDAGKVGLMQQAKSLLLQKTLSGIAKELNVDGIELPEEIASPCYAEVRWSYVERKSGFWTQQVVIATNKALEALDIDHQIEAERLFKEGVTDETLGKDDFVAIGKELDKGLGMVEASIAEKEAVNEVLLAEARGAMRGAMTYGAEIIGWDQRLVEFMGDNARWTFNRAKRVQHFAGHAKLLGETFGSLRTITAAERASETDAVLLESASAAEQQRIAAEDSAFEAQVVADLDL